ncbi:hypothetical protein M011DRAFT_479663 [Sporormia fimetaria CBS 119925]|uniref:DUF7605 domain-containing protein n=1 Tax=Sporormia fimetaria CBS 119925 TaxID=1340428 RepID=A0A6A6V261_9PLEO|nr:hypothetical protein M011DRAFT_479663 [Sporormia fimetaria CBS 119925]
MILNHTDANLENDEGTKFPSEEMIKLRDLRTQIDKFADEERNLEERRDEIEEDLDHNDKETLPAIRSRLKYVKEVKRTLGREGFELRVLARNRTASDAFRKKHKRLTGADLLVFCVSSVEYNKHLQGYDLDDTPSLSLEATGIPDLRRHLCLLLANGRFNTLKDQLEHSIPELLSNLNLSWSADDSDLRQTIMPLVEKRQKEAQSLVRDTCRKHLARFHSLTKDAMDKESPHWVKQTGILAQQWRKIDPRSYGYLMKKDGRHVIKKFSHSYDFNSQLLLAVTRTLNPIFPMGSVKPDDEFLTELTQTSLNPLDTLDRDLSSSPLSFHPVVIKIQKGIREYRKPAARKYCLSTINEYSKEMRHIRDAAVALGSGGTEAYFPDLIADVYNSAANAAGRGLHAMRCDRFESGLSSPTGPFYQLAGKIEEEVKGKLDQSESAIVAKVDKAYTTVRRDAERACPGRDKRNPVTIQFYEFYKAVIAKAELRLNEQALPAFECATRL